MNRFDHNWGLLGKTQVRKMSVQPEFCQMGYGNSSVYINHINRRAGERGWSAVPKMTYKSLPVNRLVRNKELCAGDPMCDHNPDVTGECAGVEQTVAHLYQTCGRVSEAWSWLSAFITTVLGPPPRFGFGWRLAEDDFWCVALLLEEGDMAAW